jgi:sugar phosphate isomerase/epimerase
MAESCKLEICREIIRRKTMVYSRRDFGKIALAGVPALSAMMSMKNMGIDSTFDGVRLGTITYSFNNDLPLVAGQDQIDGIIPLCQTAGVGLIELMCNHAEPASDLAVQQAAARAARMAALAAATAAGTAPAPGAGGPGAGAPGAGAAAGRGRGPSPEAMKARDDLRQWRLSTSMSHFEGIKKKFNDAGINIFAYCVNGMGDDFTSDEIDVMFAQAKALGASTISSSTTVSIAQKLVPFAEKHKYTIAYHNHADLTDPNQVCTPESIKKILAMSPYFRSNLDIAHYVEANLDPIPLIEEIHDKITHFHIADGQKNNGHEVPFGQGDTPIKAVVNLLKDKKYPIVGMIELEYRPPAGSNTALEVKKCLDYVKQAMA